MPSILLPIHYLTNANPILFVYPPVSFHFRQYYFLDLTLLPAVHGMRRDQKVDDVTDCMIAMCQLHSKKVWLYAVNNQMLDYSQFSPIRLNNICHRSRPQ